MLRASVRTRESGQTTAEYAIVLGVLTVGAVAVFALLGSEIALLLDAVKGVLPA
jgi:hypothetical protein